MTWKSTAAIYCTSVLLLTVFLVLSTISTEQDFPYGFQLTLLITSVMLPPAYHTCQILQAVFDSHHTSSPHCLSRGADEAASASCDEDATAGSDELESVRSAMTQVSTCSGSTASGGRDGAAPPPFGAVRRMFKCHFCKQLVDSEEWYSGRHSQLCPMCPSYTVPTSSSSSCGPPAPSTFSDILCPHCQQELSLHRRKGTFHCATCCKAFKNATLACRYKCPRCPYSLCLSCIQRWHWYNWMQSAREQEMEEEMRMVLLAGAGRAPGASALPDLAYSGSSGSSGSNKAVPSPAPKRPRSPPPSYAESMADSAGAAAVEALLNQSL